MKGFRLHRLAQHDLWEANDYYDRKVQGLGSDFLAEFERLIERLVTYPESARRVSGDLRMASITRFHYNVLYRIAEEEVFVLAVFHQRRKPGYGQGRH